MTWFKTTPPKDGSQFLACINDKDTPYYVFYYNTIYNPDNRYTEASGEQYMTIAEDDIIAWTSFEELDADRKFDAAHWLFFDTKQEAADYSE